MKDLIDTLVGTAKVVIVLGTIAWAVGLASMVAHTERAFRAQYEWSDDHGVNEPRP